MVFNDRCHPVGIKKQEDRLGSKLNTIGYEWRTLPEVNAVVVESGTLEPYLYCFRQHIQLERLKEMEDDVLVFAEGLLNMNRLRLMFVVFIVW